MRQSSCVQASIAWSSILVLVLIGAPCSSRLRVTAALVQRRAGVPPVSCWRASPRRGASARGRWLALTWSKRYCQAAQPAADRSAQRLIPCRRWAAPAASWVAWARSCPPWARQRAPTDAAPCLTHPPPRGPPGRHRLRCAPPVPLVPVTPNPLQGAMLGSAARAVGRRARLQPLHGFRVRRAAPARPSAPRGSQEAENPRPARRNKSIAAWRAPPVNLSAGIATSARLQNRACEFPRTRLLNVCCLVMQHGTRQFLVAVSVKQL